MYGLPSSFDPSVFVGRELELVCFSVNTITLTFDQKIRVTILRSFIYHPSPNAEAIKQTLPVASSTLMCLTGKIVRSAKADRDGTLTIQFESRESLTLVDELRGYDSYTLQIGDEEIVV